MFYAEGDYAARKGVEIGCITLHPSGLPHGPQPGTVEKALGAKSTNELAVMWDTFRPLRSYFYADPHCYNIPICWGIRSAYSATDGVDKLSEKLGELSKDVDNVDAVVPQLVALLPPQIETMRSLRTMVLTMHSTMSGMFDQANELSDDARLPRRFP